MKVYKYRGSDDKAIFKRDLNSLLENYFWASDFSILNDPFEAITDTKSIKNRLNWIAKKIGVNTEADFQLLDDNADEVLSLDSAMGIYSLSKTPVDELLWAHYANSHKGFCIEYDLDVLLSTDRKNILHSFPVKYSKKPPGFSWCEIFRNEPNSMIEKFAFYKSKRWEYEQEHRIVSSIAGKISYNCKALKSIYFGSRIEEIEKNDIIHLLKERSVDFYQIQLEKNSYSLKAVKLEV